jgi:DNA-binding transcriptional LysR family regulator
MKDLDLTSLRLFVEVCEAQSIKRVAEREQVDASSITKRLANLEAQLKTPLLKRIRHGVQPTPEGALLSEQARRLVSEAQKISDSLLKRNAPLTGTITIATHTSSMASVLTDDLSNFMKLHSNNQVNLIVKEMLSKDVVQMVREGSAAIGVIWDITETSDLQHNDYYADTIAAVMKKNHPLANRKSLSYEELVEYDLISDRNGRHVEAMLQRAGGIGGKTGRYVVQLDSRNSAIRMAANGVGIYICTVKVAEAQSQNLDVAIIPLTNNWAKLRIKIISQSTFQPPLVQRLIDHLIHQHR